MYALIALFLPLDTEVTPDDPFLAFGHFLSLMQHAISTMSVEQGHAYFKICYDRRRRGFTTARRVRVEHSLAAFTASSGRCEVEQQRPRRLGWDAINCCGGWKGDVVGIVIWKLSVCTSLSRL